MKWLVILLLSVSPVAAQDSTGFLQQSINTANGAIEVIIPCGTWNTGTGFTIPSGGAVLSFTPGCSIIHLTGNVPAFSCNGVSAPVVIRNARITGTAASFNGTINISDLGQDGVHVTNCPHVVVDNLRADNLSGSAVVCENPSGAFSTAALLHFTRISAFNSYRAIYPKNSCEYAIFSQVTARNNIFGAQILSGNVNLDGFLFSYNYNNIQIVGQSNANPCHGTVSNGMSNHGVGYNIEVLSCAAGEDFVNVRAIADGGGSLTSGGGILRIANSRGVNIVGGEIGSNIVIVQADPATGATSTAGVNKLEGAYIRDDIAGFSVPSVNYSGGLEMKSNFNASGQWSQNN